MEEGWRRTLHKKCLSNLKVWHDGMDADNLQFDVYQEVQSQNHNGTMQLLVMGYSGDILCAKFIPEKISERQATSAPVMVENTWEQQEALAKRCIYFLETHLSIACYIVLQSLQHTEHFILLFLYLAG
jgi:hypothetical protein